MKEKTWATRPPANDNIQWRYGHRCELIEISKHVLAAVLAGAVHRKQEGGEEWNSESAEEAWPALARAAVAAADVIIEEAEKRRPR